METNLGKKIYETWDEAFKALVPSVRQQSVRVASYTQVLFSQVCASSFASDSEFYSGYLKGITADLSYKCGLYHQLGKALLPPEYQIWKKEFTQEEQELYCKYTSEGRILVAALQEKNSKACARNQLERKENATNNISWMVVREVCEQHMEHWDGTGYPGGRKGGEISPIAQIVGLAKELDRLACETKSEHPFEDAFQVLQAESGRSFSPDLIEVLKSCRGKCRKIFNQYIQYTRTIPKTIPLLEKRKDRPMGLSYLPMIRETKGAIHAYEAMPWFSGILDRPGEKEGLKDVEALLYRTDLVDDITMYFLYEAADTVLRIQNCDLPLEGILLPMMGKFYTTGDKMNRIRQLYEEQPIDKRMLMLTIPHDVLLNADAQTMNFISQLLDEGIPLVLDGYRPQEISVETVRKSGISMVRLAPELYLSQETTNAMKMLRNYGIQLIGGEANDHGLVTWLTSSGVTFMSGTAIGTPVTEEELIHDGLLREDEYERR